MGKRPETQRERLFSVTLDDCRVDTFRSGGKGGQHQNKTESGVRITHPPSGAVGESREERSQLQNKKRAFRRMVADPRFLFWVAQERRRLETGKTLEERVSAEMHDELIRTEVHDAEGRWVETTADQLG